MLAKTANLAKVAILGRFRFQLHTGNTLYNDVLFWETRLQKEIKSKGNIFKTGDIVAHA